ncbi:MAG: beta-glucosidase, partial [Bacteroidetes bacterium]
LSLDPRWMEDKETNYWKLNVSQTLINRAYCIEKAPKEFGYSDNNWGLTAGDNFNFYGAHAPSVEDNSTINPTAAMSSFAYTPAYAMDALMYFYRIQGNRLFGEYGFYDGYSQLKNWYSNQYLAIDQGPIVIMIENYRSGLLWNLGSQIAEIQAALPKMGIRKPDYPTGFYMYIPEANSGETELIRHPDEGKYVLDFFVKGTEPANVELVNEAGMAIKMPETYGPGAQRLLFDAQQGNYTAKLRQGALVAEAKLKLR